MIRILIAEDQRLVNDALAQLLDMETDITVVAQATDGSEACELARRLQPDVALLDIEMPRKSGLEVISELAHDVPACRCLIVTTFARSGYLERAVQNGAWGYILKDAKIEEVAAAIRSVHAGQRVMAHDLLVAAVAQKNPLSERDIAILKRIENGHSTREIAASLFVTEGTVRNYLSEILSKLGATSRQEAVRVAQDAGWL
jgi:two-component system response regulator DesR